MGYQWQYVKPGAGRPVPNFADPLWRGCKFASTVGSIGGHRQIANPAGDIDEVTGARSRIFTTGGFTPNGVNWQRWTCGRGFDNGDGATSNNPQGWDGNAGAYYDVPTDSGFTAACLIRPDVQNVDPTIPFFKRRSQPYGAAQPGWDMHGMAGGLYQVAYSDGGANNRQRQSTTVQDATGHRVDLVIMRILNEAPNTRMQLYVNGVREANTTFAFTAMGNPAGEDIKILGYGPLNELFSGWVPFAAMWGRPLADGELNRLYSDPFVMWRRLNSTQDFGSAGNRGSIDIGAGVRFAPPSPVFANFAPGGASAGACCCCAGGTIVTLF